MTYTREVEVNSANSFGIANFAHYPRPRLLLLLLLFFANDRKGWDSSIGYSHWWHLWKILEEWGSENRAFCGRRGLKYHYTAGCKFHDRLTIIYQKSLTKGSQAHSVCFHGYLNISRYSQKLTFLQQNVDCDLYGFGKGNVFFPF